jgi:hypothetical protein
MPRFNANSGVIINKTIAVPGTAEQLAQHFIPDGLSVQLKADIDNTGNVFIGFSQAGAQGTARIQLISGESITLNIDSLDRIWMDADGASDKLDITILKQG